MPCYCMGLMSGTSVDGVNASIVEICDDTIKAHAHLQVAIPHDLQQEIHNTIASGQSTLAGLLELDHKVAILFAECANALMARCQLSTEDITVIGSHGQTLWHNPEPPRNSLQIGNANVIATMTKVPTIGDFRRMDMALGGQGAPLVPPFHQAVFQDATRARVVINLGGIANVTYLAAKSQTDNTALIGFDTGPGNTLMDHWIQSHQQVPFDRDGAWAQQGNIIAPLLQEMLRDPYFQKPPPKSTGREYFHAPWLQQKLADNIYPAVDVQRTLLELTAVTLTDVIRTLAPDDIILTGGGAHNVFLKERLAELLPHASIISSDTLGFCPDHIESMAFAWLAYRSWHGLTGNACSVTGATRPAVLGALYRPTLDAS